MLRRRFMMIKSSPEPPTPVYPTDGLVHEFLFEGDLTDTGSSPVTATGSNVVGYPDGKVGKCLSLDRTSNVAARMQLPNQACDGCRTFSIWFKRGTGLNTTSQFYVARPSGSVYLYISTSQVRVVQASSTYVRFTGGIATSDTSWHHLVITLPTVSGSNCTLAAYMDGSALTTAATSGTMSTSTVLNSIFRYVGAAGTGTYNLGYYDQYRIYNRVLTDAEIAQLYNNGQGV